MKYAFGSFSCKDRDLDGIFTVAGKYGYQGFEPRLGVGHKHGIEIALDAEERKRVKRKASEYGMEICCLATSCSFANRQTCKENVSMAKMCIDLAYDIGAPLIRVFGTNQKGIIIEDAFDPVAESLDSLGGYACEKNVTVCLETHDNWSDPLIVSKLMLQLDHPSLMVNWDMMHTVRDGGATVDGAFELLKKWIRHVHIHDALNQPDKMVFMPMGEGDFDHSQAVRLLKTINYNGYLSGEWTGNWEPYEIHLPREINVMKKYEKELE